MSDLSCRRAELIESDADMGRAGDADLMRHEVHLQRCERCAERAGRLRALADVLREEADHIEAHRTDRATIMGAIMEAGGGAPARPPKRVSPLWLAAAAVVLGVGIGAGAVWLGIGAGEPTVAEQHGTGGTAGETSTQGAGEPAPEGGAVGDRDTPAGKAPPPALATGQSEPCSGVGTEASDDAHGYVISSRGDSCRIVLDVGRVLFDVDPSAETALSVHTPTTTVRVVGTQFEVRVGASGQTEVDVRHGRVRVEAGGDSRTLSQGERFASESEPTDWRTPGTREGTDDAAAEPEAAGSDGEAAEAAGAVEQVAELRKLIADGRTAEARAEARQRSERSEGPGHDGQLLTVIAESWVREGDYRRAAASYRRVWVEHPGSATAANALIAAAHLQLERLGQAGRAQGLYERYLQDHPRGALREPAFVGRCRTLRAQGREEAADTCLRSYLAAYPSGRLRDRAKQLLDHP